jgi:hypothetical protein
VSKKAGKFSQRTVEEDAVSFDEVSNRMESNGRQRKGV